MNRHRLSDPLLRMQPDERLAALAAHGGERAFAALVERHRPALLAFARRLGAAGGAEDVVQQALLQAWSALERGTRVEHVSAWLHRIVRNAAIRAAASSLESMELPATLVAATATADEVEMRQRTRDLLAEIERLPARQREALLRLAVDGSSGAEAGRQMALEANAVRQLAHRARVRLRTAMGALVPWPLALWAARGGGGGVTAVESLPELVGGGVAGGAGATAGAGLLKVGVLATTTAAVAAGAVGIVPHRAKHHRSSAPRAVVAAGAGGGAASAAATSGSRSAAGRHDGTPHTVGTHDRGGVGGSGANGSSDVSAPAGGSPRAGGGTPRDAGPRSSGSGETPTGRTGDDGGHGSGDGGRPPPSQPSSHDGGDSGQPHDASSSPDGEGGDGSASDGSSHDPTPNPASTTPSSSGDG